MTPNTTGFDFADVVLVRFPFTDQRGSKQRPAAIVSSAGYHRHRPDSIILAITSRTPAGDEFGVHLLRDWQAAGLLKPSAFKPVITTVESALILRRLGRLSATDRTLLVELLATVIGPETRTDMPNV